MEQGMMFTRVLITNRGAIDTRIIRTLRQLGIESVELGWRSTRGAPRRRDRQCPQQEQAQDPGSHAQALAFAPAQGAPTRAPAI